MLDFPPLPFPKVPVGKLELWIDLELREECRVELAIGLHVSAEQPVAREVANI